MTKSCTTDGERSCTYEANLRTLMQAAEKRNADIDLAGFQSKTYRLAWDKFWDIARTIKPCRCDKCTAARVLRAVSNEPYRNFVHEIADTGWGPHDDDMPI